MTRRVLSTLVACAVLSTAAIASAEDFWMLFQNQRVTLTARDVSVTRILDRWSQLGGTVVVNSAAIHDGPVSLQLTDVPEREALEILLRGAAGYIVADREDGSTGASSISKILILPSTSSGSQPRANAALERAVNLPPVDVRVEQAPIPTADTVEFVPRPAEGPAYVPPALIPIPVLPAGTSRPGETAAQAPALFRPGSAPTSQPGQAPPLERMIQRTGPGAAPPPAVVPSPGSQ